MLKDFTALVGRTIQSIWLSANAHGLVVVTDEGPIFYYSEGDCCSESWFYHILGVQDAINQPVTSQRMNFEDQPTDDDSDRPGESILMYSFTFTTPRGHVDIEFRNASNGYYNGWLTTLSVTEAKWFFGDIGFAQLTDDYTQHLTQPATTPLQDIHPTYA